MGARWGWGAMASSLGDEVAGGGWGAQEEVGKGSNSRLRSVHPFEATGHPCHS